MGNVKYAINQPPLGQLDSRHYNYLRGEVGFDDVFSWNFRGYVATWRINGNKLYLEALRGSSDKADFRDALKDFKDSRGNIFASWFSGTVICGTGSLLCASGNGWDDLNETEVELVIQSGVVTASRKYRNKQHKGTINRDVLFKELPKKFNYRDFPELKGFRIPMKLIPSKYDRTGRILDWTVKYLKWPEEVEPGVQDRLTAAFKKELLQYDCQTYCADGRWFWRDRNPSDSHFDGVVWPLIFKKEYFVPAE
ncbi:MAG: hypothetical protein IJK44_00670 [Bacteroidales bacterium]|nr:hypothetical protein [Bacteroidales bacterium]